MFGTCLIFQADFFFSSAVERLMKMVVSFDSDLDLSLQEKMLLMKKLPLNAIPLFYLLLFQVLINQSEPSIFNWKSLQPKN